MECPVCGANGVVEIRMQVGNRDVQFRRCVRCENQNWRADDHVIDLAEVRGLVRS
jgi:hypothetical protein